MQEQIIKIGREDKLQSALISLEPGQSLEVPYKMYSAPTIRSTATQLKLKGLVYEVNASGNRVALVKRLS